MPSVIIIGAGIAGIASALRLRSLGLEVAVFESNPYPGGKLHAFELSGYRFDAGPSLFTMPELVTELFELFDIDSKDYFTYSRKETLCNYFWEDGKRFIMRANIEESTMEAAELFGVEQSKLIKYLNKSKKKFELTSPLFLEKSLHKIGTYLSMDTLKALANLPILDLSSTLNAVNEKNIMEPHLVQLFNRYATYNGSSPYKTPGIMSMIPHLEMGLGTYFPKGGMHSITKSLFKLAEDQGVRFYFNSRIEEIIIENKKAVGIRTSEGNQTADFIVSNMDVYSTYSKLCPKLPAPKKVLNQERSSSAIIFYWGIRHLFPELDLHNIFFTQDYKQEFECLFEKKSVYNDPTIYINITSKEESYDAPKDSENWFVMVNAPGDFGQDWDKIIQETRKNIISKLSRILNTDIESLIEVEDILTPPLIERKTSSYRGSLYGTASNSKFAAFLRHPNFSNRIENLFYCGGSVHPGGGIPLCLLSAKITADLITKDL